MLKRNIGDFEASVVAFGAWAIGGWMWGGTEESESIKAIHAAFDSGITMIDTAPAYGFGNSEIIVGKAIKQLKREKVIIATKCGLIWHDKLGEKFFDSDEKGPTEASSASKEIYRCLRPEIIRYEVEESLKRLGTDYIDLYQTHWQDPTTPIEESMEALLQLKKEGKIRAIGCSNATPEDMQKYLSVGQLDVDQEKYSMLDRDLETTNLEFAATNNISFLAYSPLGQGLLTGKIGADRNFEEGDQRLDNPRFSIENRAKVMTMLNEFKQIADNHNATLGQLAIAWTFHKRGCSHVLIGARTPAQARENALAGDIKLTVAEIDLIQAAISKYAPNIC